MQTKSAGPLDLVAADYYGAEQDRPAGIRSFARCDEVRFAALLETRPTFESITGEGVVAITIEPKMGGQRYQGIVSLAQKSIAASAEAYSRNPNNCRPRSGWPRRRCWSREIRESSGWRAG